MSPQNENIDKHTLLVHTSKDDEILVTKAEMTGLFIIIISLVSVDNLQSRIYVYSKNSSVLANLSQLS